MEKLMLLEASAFLSPADDNRIIIVFFDKHFSN